MRYNLRGLESGPGNERKAKGSGKDKKKEVCRRAQTDRTLTKKERLEDPVQGE